jgi:serpin B
MYAHEIWSYRDTATAQVVEVPYWDGFALDLVVPHAADATATESALKRDGLDAFTSGMTPAYVELHLPRLRMDWSGNLIPALQALGLKAAFSPGADLSGIASGGPLHLDSIVHKATLTWDEVGTEADASTAMGIALSAEPAPTQQAVVRVVHPFLFLIRDTESGAILFMGRVVDPR